MDGRNDPNGYDPGEQPQRYRIREVVRPNVVGSRYQIRGSVDPEYELGDVVERVTVPSHDPVTHRVHHALQEPDQLYADLCARRVQEACEWFYDPAWKPLAGVPDIVLTDDEIRTSIHTLNHGENKREGVRTSKPWYDLEALPWVRQRALIEQLYALRREWGFQKLGPVTAQGVETAS